MEEDICLTGLEDTVWIQMLKTAEARELYRAVLNLPSRTRETVYTFYILNYKIKEIADLTGQKPDPPVERLARQRSDPFRGIGDAPPTSSLNSFRVAK